MAALLVNPAGVNQSINYQRQQSQPQQVQPQPQVQQQAAPDLNDLTYFNNRSYGGIGEEEVNSERGRKALDAVRKYDPNAQYTAVHSGDGNLIGYQMQFDPSKLPGTGSDNKTPLGGANPYGAGGNSYASGSGFMPRFSTVQEHMNLANPNAVYNSSHYGKITDNRNIYDKPDLIGQLAPYAIMALGGWAGGALSPMLSAVLKSPQMIGQMASGGGFNPLSVASLAAPMIPGAGAVMPYLNLARTAYSLGGGH